jgi:hypothetical protein
MKVILKIGYNELLLPDDTNIAAVMKTLSRGVLIHSNRTYDHKQPKVVLTDRQLDVELKYVPEKTVFTMVREDDKTETEQPVNVKQLKAAPRALPLGRGGA